MTLTEQIFKAAEPDKVATMVLAHKNQPLGSSALNPNDMGNQIVRYGVALAKYENKRLKPLILALAECAEAAERTVFAVTSYAEKGLIENYVRDNGMALSDYIDDAEEALTTLRQALEGME